MDQARQTVETPDAVGRWVLACRRLLRTEPELARLSVGSGLLVEILRPQEADDRR